MPATTKAPRSISAVLARAAQIGVELHGPLNTLRVHRLTRVAWEAEVLALAGSPEALADAVARVAKRRHLHAHLEKVARQWAPAESIDGPAAEHSIGDFDRHVAAATQAAIEGLGPEMAGAIIGDMVLQHPTAEFGPAPHRGAARDRIAALHAELDALDVELRGLIPDELVLEVAHLRGPDGRLVDWFEPQPARHFANVVALGLPPVLRAA